MGRFDTIKTTIDANIKENGSQEITGQKMNSILTEIVNATDAELTELELGRTNTNLIQKNDDVNDYKSVGIFRIEDSNTAGTLVNKPEWVTNAAMLQVIEPYVDNVIQIIYNAKSGISFRTFQSLGSVWSEWQRVASESFVTSLKSNLELGINNPNIIPNNDDVNDYKSVGIFRIEDSNAASSISNLPEWVTNASILQVIEPYIDTALQIIYNATSGISFRTFQSFNQTWSEWQKVASESFVANKVSEIESIKKNAYTNNSFVNGIIQEIYSDADININELDAITIRCGYLAGNLYYNAIYLEKNGSTIHSFEKGYESIESAIANFSGVLYSPSKRIYFAVDNPKKVLNYHANIEFVRPFKSVVIENYIKTLTIANPLYGKVVSLNGDSICAGAGYAGGYGKIIADRNSMVYENIAVGGGTLCAGTYYDAGGARHWICRTIINMREDADYIILEGGVNDASMHIDLGEISNNYDAELNDETYCGALESTFKQAIERFKGKKIGFVIPHKMTAPFSSESTEYEYYPKTIAICKKWGIPYIDLNTECPPLRYIPSLQAEYTKDGDGWHPNEQGYKKYYCDKIEAWMKTL